jgi:glycosyltransferase involved in cell wall biosynthesis
MKISIITINLNNKDGLVKTLESVFIQTFENKEIVVIDGDSADGSKDYLLVNSKRINYWISEPDRGVYNAMNKGLLQSTGDYVIFMNSGDVFYDKYVLSNFCDKANGEDLIYGLSIWSDTKKYWNPPRDIKLKDTISKVLIPHQATFYKRIKILKLGGYREEYKIISDWAIFIDFITNGYTYNKIDLVICLSEPAGLSFEFFKIIKKEKYNFLSKKSKKYLSWYFFYRIIDTTKNIFSHIIKPILKKNR